MKERTISRICFSIISILYWTRTVIPWSRINHYTQLTLLLLRLQFQLVKNGETYFQISSHLLLLFDLIF